MKKGPIVVGLFFISVGLAVAVFAIPWVTAGSVQAQASSDGKPHKEIVLAVEKVVDGETISAEARIIFEDAPEIPESAPDAYGLFLSRDERWITIGSGPIDVSVQVEVINDQDPTRIVSASHSGEPVTFRVSDNTVFLKDTTQRPDLAAEDIAAASEFGEIVVQGTTSIGSLEEIGENTVLRVWGEIQNGVLVAKLVVFEVLE